jgi:hypothetical protein
MYITVTNWISRISNVKSKTDWSTIDQSKIGQNIIEWKQNESS